ncbi:ABC-F family ATP-binding cassette domain-containing protein [Berryella wangjianweii]|uniref:ABC-F family ATP-binding cassette domain-containing protein n=1 Tax=Berryella wangjianweii TaxID=2734634 RepID=A0A6M8J034_9ACTN|nr:ABC-F family ATP-binding cassette domain-containing protein [Berryella wangjianweii]QKF07340.1 ABC-F family ATP-binding cassette domain-containing protein [Berryella wangjianweii]
MAFLLGCEKAALEFSTKTVFESVSIGVDEGARIGVVGRNGDGKSTLLGLLAGAIQPDSGRVVRTGGVSVGLLGQSDALNPAHTVLRAIVGDAPEHEWAASPRVRSILAGLVGDVDPQTLVGSLSGGQRRRVDLARLLVGEWDVLMLDEPTNHLDVRAISWLAGHLKTRWKDGKGALLVVTHDRWFLDEVCLTMWEVHDRVIEPFEGGFSAYIMQRVERDRVAAVMEERRQNKLRRELAWLSRGARARSTKPKFHVAQAQALIADVPPLRDEVALKRMAVARLGKDVIDFKNVGVTLGGRPILRDLTWIIGPGDRVGLLGCNGAGKTTLLRTIQGLQQPTTGRVKIGKTVRIALLSQHLDELAEHGSDRVRQVVGRYSARVMLDGKERTPAQLLEQLGFSKADLSEPVCDLSGGQKRRLALMLILLDQPNVLILDEPGNDLDVDMLASVEDLLDGWPGTLVLVTHDRYLMERVTDNQYALIDGQLRHVPGGVDEYLRLADAREAASAALAGSWGVAGCGTAGGATAGAGGGSASGGEAGIDGGLSNAQRRALKKELLSLDRRMSTARKKIEGLRQEMHEVDPTDYVLLGQMQRQVNEAQDALDELELAWLEASERLEAGR